jgi:hypothetical protein
MTPKLRKTLQHPQPGWIGCVKFLWIVFLTVTFFLLAQTMVRHGFFTGGSLDYRSTAPRP